MQQLNYNPNLDTKIAARTGVANWFNECVDFVQTWSPRSYPGYAQGVALWIMSTVAARRVVLKWADTKFTNLMIVLVGMTTITAKSSAARVGYGILKDCGFDWLLLPNSTPQKFIFNMGLHVPSNYSEEDEDIVGLLEHWYGYYDSEKLKLAHNGARGWFYDEFGGFLSSLTRPDGVRSPFREIFRQIDDPNIPISNDTVSRGNDEVKNPYLALLGTMTPADMAPIVQKDKSLWRDGFLSRLCFITPPEDFVSYARWPDGERVTPDSIKKPLKEWHKRLGSPDVYVEEIEDEEGKKTGRYRVDIDPEKRQECRLGNGVRDAYYSYNDNITRKIHDREIDETLFGSYGRLPEKALRVAMLFASMENDGLIEIDHWQLAEFIAENWRRDLHALKDQVEANHHATIERSLEDRVVSVILKLKAKGDKRTPRNIAIYSNISTRECKNVLKNLFDAGILSFSNSGKAVEYDVN